MRQRGFSYFRFGLVREYKVCNFGLKAEIQWSLKRRGRGSLVSQAKGENHWSLKQTCQLLVCVLRLSHYFTKRVLATEERYMRILSDCIPTYTQSSPSKNKNINYIFIYLRVFRCLSSGSIYYNRSHNRAPDLLSWEIPMALRKVYIRKSIIRNAACNPEQVMAATPHKTPTVRPPAPYHENYSS